MQIRVLRTKKELMEVKAAWEDLIADSIYSAPFYSWFWCERWWKSFGQGAELYIICVYEGDILLAIAPMMKEKVSLRGIPVTEIHFLDNGISPRNHFLHRKSDKGLNAVRHIFRSFIANRNEWDLINLRSIDSGAPYLACLLAMERLSFIDEKGLRSPFIKIQKSFENYMLEIFNSKQRNDQKRGLKKVAREGQYRVEKKMELNDIEDALSTLFKVSHNSWKGSVKTDMAATSASKKFYEDVTRHFSMYGQVIIWILYLEKKAIAAHYFMSDDKKVYFMINDFDKEYYRISPGKVLLYHVIEEFHKEKICEFDFGGDNLDYKWKWCREFREHRNIQVFNKRGVSNFIYMSKDRFLPLLREVKKNIKI